MIVQTESLGVEMQLVSTGGTAAPGERIVMESESLLNTSNCVPVELETTVCAEGTAIVASPPVAKFMTATAPRNKTPPMTAFGTPAYPTPAAGEITMLFVNPGR